MADILKKNTYRGMSSHIQIIVTTFSFLSILMSLWLLIPLSEEGEDELALMQLTSGSTGSPKAVQITHRNIWVNATTFALHAGVTDRDVYLHTLPMFHANGWGMPFAMTGLGVPQIVLRKVDGAEILRRVRDHGVTVMCAAPAVAATRRAEVKALMGPGVDLHSYRQTRSDIAAMARAANSAEHAAALRAEKGN